MPASSLLRRRGFLASLAFALWRQAVVAGASGTEVAIGAAFGFRAALVVADTTAIVEPFSEVSDHLVLSNLFVAVGIHFSGRHQPRHRPFVEVENAVAVFVVLFQVLSRPFDHPVGGE